MSKDMICNGADYRASYESGFRHYQVLLDFLQTNKKPPIQRGGFALKEELKLEVLAVLFSWCGGPGLPLL